MKQQILFKELVRQAEFGGSLLKGKRKSRRPFSKDKPMHFTFRTSHYRLTSKRVQIGRLIVKLGEKHGVRIYERSVNSNHLHILTQTPIKKCLQNFLRELSIKIVSLVAGARKGKNLLCSFWDSRPWSRIVEWGKAYQIVKNYIFRNRLETEALIPYNRKIKTAQILVHYKSLHERSESL